MSLPKTCALSPYRTSGFPGTRIAPAVVVTCSKRMLSGWLVGCVPTTMQNMFVFVFLVAACHPALLPIIMIAQCIAFYVLVPHTGNDATEQQHVAKDVVVHGWFLLFFFLLACVGVWFVNGKLMFDVFVSQQNILFWSYRFFGILFSTQKSMFEYI